MGRSDGRDPDADSPVAAVSGGRTRRGRRVQIQEGTAVRIFPPPHSRTRFRIPLRFPHVSTHHTWKYPPKNTTTKARGPAQKCTGHRMPTRAHTNFNLFFCFFLFLLQKRQGSEPRGKQNKTRRGKAGATCRTGARARQRRRGRNGAGGPAAVREDGRTARRNGNRGSAAGGVAVDPVRLHGMAIRGHPGTWGRRSAGMCRPRQVATQTPGARWAERDR